MKYKLRQLLFIIIVVTIVAAGGYGIYTLPTSKGLHSLSGNPVEMGQVTGMAPIVVVN